MNTIGHISMPPSIHTSGVSRALRSVFYTASSHNVILPTFLVPALLRQPISQSANFSSTCPTRSKIGREPLSLPPEVTFKVMPPPIAKSGRVQGRSQPGSTVYIEGPLGKMSLGLPPYVSIQSDEEAGQHVVSIEDPEDKKQKAMWGTTRAYLQNHIMGVSEGHTAILRLNGVGYRATVEDSAATKRPQYEGQKFVSLKVGYSHPIELGVPMGMNASCPQPTRILLEGADKEVVMQFAGEIRAWRRPEPYKGKGIFVNDETIRLKAKKIK